MYESIPTAIMPPWANPRDLTFLKKTVKFPTVRSKISIKIPTVQAKALSNAYVCLPFRFSTFNTKIEIYLKQNKAGCKNINNAFVFQL